MYDDAALVLLYVEVGILFTPIFLTLEQRRRKRCGGPNDFRPLTESKNNKAGRERFSAVEYCGAR